MLAQLRRNLALLYGAEALGKVLGLVVFGYLARVLLTARYGDLEFALGILYLMNLVIDAGLGHYGAREVAKRPQDADRLIGQITFVRVTLVCVSLLLLGAVAALLPRHDRLATSLILLQGLVLIPTPLSLSWVFQARDEMHVVALASVLRQAILATGVLLLVRAPGDVWQVPVWDSVGLASAVGLQVLLYVRAGGAIRPLHSFAGLGTVVRESAPIAGSSVVWAVRLFAPLLSLGIFSNSFNVGVFGAGHRLVIAVHTFVWLYYFNLLPSLSRLGAEPGLSRFKNMFTTSMRLIGWVALFGASLGTALAPLLIPLMYGDGMAVAGRPFAIMVWVLAAAFVSGHHRFSLIALSRQGVEFWANVAGAAVSVLGCLLLGSGLTPIAAAWIFVAAETTTLLVAAVSLSRAVPQIAVFGGLARPAAFTLVALAVMRAPLSPVVTTAAVTLIYVVGIFAFEREDLGRLLALRAETDRA